MKISVIVPYGGNDGLRSRNFDQCITSIKLQKYQDYELIVVEQSMDGNFYKESQTEYKWIGIKNPNSNGFNLSWCRNVGAKIALGDIIVLMDSDMSFQEDYLNEVSKFEGKFAAGSNLYHWIWREEVTNVFIHGRNFDYVYNYGQGNPKDPVFRFEPFTKGCGYGAVLVFDRLWFWEFFGGYTEDHNYYGWEDKSAAELIKHLLNKQDHELDRINYPMVHLSHYNKDVRNMKKNEELYYKIKDGDKDTIISLAKTSNLGDITGPKCIIS